VILGLEMRGRDDEYGGKWGKDQCVCSGVAGKCARKYIERGRQRDRGLLRTGGAVGVGVAVSVCLCVLVGSHYAGPCTRAIVGYGRVLKRSSIEPSARASAWFCSALYLRGPPKQPGWDEQWFGTDVRVT